MNTQLSIKTYFSDDKVRAKFSEVLGKKAPGFIASMLSVVNSNKELAKADPQSVYSAAMIAATLDLPINQNLGFAYIIPYKTKEKAPQVINGKEIMVESYVTKAQFQMGYKGFVQLAQRSGTFKTINVSNVKEGEIKNIDRLTGEIGFEWIKENREKVKTVGFVGYFRLLNGFEKYFYMTIEELQGHGLKYSKTFKKYNSGLWVDEFEAMASKTVIKLLLSKYAPLTTEMQTAQLADQAFISESGYQYIDNEKETPEDMAKNKERQRIINHINESTSIEQLNLCQDALNGDVELEGLFTEKYNSLSEKK